MQFKVHEENRPKLSVEVLFQSSLILSLLAYVFGRIYAVPTFTSPNRVMDLFIPISPPFTSIKYTAPSPSLQQCAHRLFPSIADPSSSLNSPIFSLRKYHLNCFNGIKENIEGAQRLTERSTHFMQCRLEELKKLEMGFNHCC